MRRGRGCQLCRNKQLFHVVDCEIEGFHWTVQKQKQKQIWGVWWRLAHQSLHKCSFMAESLRMWDCFLVFTLDGCKGFLTPQTTAHFHHEADVQCAPVKHLQSTKSIVQIGERVLCELSLILKYAKNKIIELNVSPSSSRFFFFSISDTLL